MRPAVGILTIVVERVIYMKIRQIWFKKIAKKMKKYALLQTFKTFFRLIFVNPEIGFCVSTRSTTKKYTNGPKEHLSDA